MRCQVDKGQIGDSGEYPCSVCKKRVGSNSGMCVKNITVGSIKDAAAFRVSGRVIVISIAQDVLG